MSLIGTLNLAGNALAVQQAALQTTSNNISNAGNANYTRETANLTPGVDQQLQPGVSIGTGVDLTSITRQIDQALQSRINSATADSSSASTSSNYLGQVQSTLNALGADGSTLSSQLSTFFNGWSSLANNPTDDGARQVVVQNGVELASYIQTLGSQLTALQSTVNTTVANQATSADTLASDIATLNGQIVTAQSGAAGTANSLLDQRDADVLQLSQLMNVQTVAQPDGTVNVYVGSEPLVTGTTSNGVAVKQQSVNGEVQNVIVFKSSNSNIQITSGSIAGLTNTEGEIANVVGQLNSITGNLIFQVNKLTSSGQGTTGVTSATATNAVTSTTAALSDTTDNGLKFATTTGSFVVHVTNTNTGLTTSTLVHVDENGTGTDTTLDSLTAQLNGIANVTAADTNGTLAINSSGSDQQITFSDDTSGTLAALGINSFFTGNDSTNIAVNSTVQNNLSLVTAAQNGESADNQTALAISTLGDAAQTGLNGQSINQAYQNMVNGVATQAAGATADATSTAQVVSTLQSQRQNLSGVSLDEETVNLLQEQNAYQAAARVITTVNTMMTDLMNLIPA
jgi:flagellar hook-associated protein 1 FlgK